MKSTKYTSIFTLNWYNNVMVTLKIKNFGPIKNGFTDNDGFMNICKFSVFIGEQGAGKSTVAKLYSSFSWLEKALFRGDYGKDDFTEKDFIDLCKNQQLPASYFTQDSELAYYGDFANFTYIKNHFTITLQQKENYKRPKIMYIASERNVISVLAGADKIKNLPQTIKWLQQEIKKSKNEYFTNNDIVPLGKYSLKYDESTDSLIVSEPNSNVALPVAFASSGLQSMIPLMLVTEYLSQDVSQSNLKKLRALSSDEQSEILSGIKNENVVKNLNLLFVSGVNKNFTDNDILDYSDSYSKYINEYLINIVEEPEQNLFPESQKWLVDSLVIHANKRKNNSLLITTHSPYVLETLNNCIYAGTLRRQGFHSEKIKEQKYHIDYCDVSAYVIKEGSIYDIKDSEIEQINPAEIDTCSKTINEEYSRLEDLEFSDHE